MIYNTYDGDAKVHFLMSGWTPMSDGYMNIDWY